MVEREEVSYYFAITKCQRNDRILNSINMHSLRIMIKHYL